MRNIIFYLIASVILLPACGLYNSSKFNSIDEEQSLIGTKLGEHIQEVPYFLSKEEDGKYGEVPGEIWHSSDWREASHEVINRIPSELKKLPIDSELTYLVNDKRVIVVVASVITTDFNMVEDALEALYGKPTERTNNVITWKGDINTLNLTRYNGLISIRLKDNTLYEAAERDNRNGDNYVEGFKGFRDIRLGSDISENSDLIRYPEKDVSVEFLNDISELCYIKKNENLNIGDIKLKKIYYYYYKRKLSSIKIDYHSSDFYALLNTLEAKYGKATYGPNLRYEWENNDVWLSMVNEADQNRNNNQDNISYVADDEILYQSKIISAIQEKDSEEVSKAKERARLNSL